MGVHVELRQFFGTLQARWRFALVTFVLGAIATVVLVTSMAPQYGSTVKIFMSTPGGGQTEYVAAYTLQQRVASYADLAVDPAVLQTVVDRLNLDESPTQLAGQISATVVTGTINIQIDVTADTAEQAQLIAGAEADAIVALVKRLERPATSGQAAAVTARIAADPSFRSSPVAPNVPLNLAAGLLLSLFLAIAGALVRDLLDRTVKSRRDVETITSSAVLATLPFYPQVKKEPLSAETGGNLAEAFRVLRTNLQFVKLDAERQAILVSSALPNEGKTLTATNLAISMAQSGRSVLLIDADMRNPNVAELLGLENSVGLLSVLVGRTTIEQAIQPHVSGISFMGTGPAAPNPAEVLESRAMRDLLARVRNEFDTVIIDAPPMLPVADASILLTEVDGALLLVRHGSTTREQLRLAVERVETVGGQLFGCVLNRTPRRASDDAYGYGYGHGYGYGSALPQAVRPEQPEKSGDEASTLSRS
ncbi:MAG: polysaccharide biosynthesis tyrosine autokinase [Actinomycetales bacterium]|nr:MAG: polysaccharide biosynthesis tyrosine autokinase [Actinomycetales bacterium]